MTVRSLRPSPHAFAALLALALIAAPAAPAQTPAQSPATDTPAASTAQPQNPAAAQTPAAPRPLPTAPSATQQTVPPTSPQPQLQQRPPQPASPAPLETEGIPYTYKVQANEVNLVFTVTDRKGRFVTGLKQQNFALLDDGHAPLGVVNFKQETNLPLRVGIVLDTSSSIRQRFQFEQDSAIEFLLQILHRNDRAFVEGFDIQTNLAQDFTNNPDLLNQGIRRLRPGGGTALFDALYKTCHEQMLTLQDDYAVRRVLILVSDGDDNYSRALESEAIKMCQRAETTVYAISTNVSPSKDKGDEVLKAIAEATGGQPFYPTRIEDVANAFRNIEEELRSQYSLGYRPADFRRDGSFRTIYLQATSNKDYHVRVRKGYFAPRTPQ